MIKRTHHLQTLAWIVVIALLHWLMLSLFARAIHAVSLQAITHDVQVSLLLEESSASATPVKRSSVKPQAQLEPPRPVVPSPDAATITEGDTPTSSEPPPTASANTEAATTLPADARFQFANARVLSYEVKGQAKGLNYFASGRLWWQQDGSRYNSRLEVSAFLLGTRTYVSQGHISELGLMPDTYFDPARKDQVAQFDYEVGRISFADHSPDSQLLTGTQDRLSVFLQLGALIASQPEHYPVGTLLPFMTSSTSATDLWQFSVEKTEVLTLPFGEIPTVKLTRMLRHAEDQSIEIWYAPALQYLPARLRITKPNGDFIDQQLKAVENPSP
jgi:hypothetical protein